MKAKNTNIIVENKDIALVFAVTAGVLAVPLVLMQFSNDVAWGLPDFTIMGTLLLVTGLLVAIAVRNIKDTTQRVFAVLALLGGLALVWAELAVGIFGTPLSGS